MKYIVPFVLGTCWGSVESMLPAQDKVPLIATYKM
jgi:hypothetical protein